MPNDNEDEKCLKILLIINKALKRVKAKKSVLNIKHDCKKMKMIAL